MMRTLIVLLLAILAPAFAADAPAPSGDPAKPERAQGFVLIRVENVIQLTDLVERMTAALKEQDAEIQRLRRLAARGGCV